MASLTRPLNYNENQVKSGDASLLLAANFLQEKDDLTFYDKQNRFEQLMKLNTRTKEKVVHFSINFSSKDRIDQSELAQIAEEYMEKLGFGRQPFLVYQHYDTAHTHLHVVSTLIKPDGKRISTHNIEHVKSLSVCREMENNYGLIKADKKEKNQSESILTHNPLKLQYGQQETKKGITNVLNAVLNKYKYTSLEELNAVLKLYNVKADRGPEEGLVFKNSGLYYRILDDDGNIRGKPIKASSIYSKPTLDYLEQRFEENKITRLPLKKRIKTAIDWQLKVNPNITLPELIDKLKDEKIHLVLRQNDQHLIYGITYIDVKNKVIFNGSDLGKEYAADGIKNRIRKPQTTVSQIVTSILPAKVNGDYNFRNHEQRTEMRELYHETKPPRQAYPSEYLPYELKKNKKRKRRKGFRM